MLAEQHQSAVERRIFTLDPAENAADNRTNWAERRTRSSACSDAPDDGRVANTVGSLRAFHRVRIDAGEVFANFVAVRAVPHFTESDNVGLFGAEHIDQLAQRGVAILSLVGRNVMEQTHVLRLKSQLNGVAQGWGGRANVTFALVNVVGERVAQVFDVVAILPPGDARVRIVKARKLIVGNLNARVADLVVVVVQFETPKPGRS